MTIDLTAPFRADPPDGYRRNVGIMLLNRDGLAFVGKRIDTLEHAWQMPQGGIDAGEAPAAAALRELEEEVGTARAEILAETPGWLAMPSTSFRPSSVSIISTSITLSLMVLR